MTFGVAFSMTHVVFGMPELFFFRLMEMLAVVRDGSPTSGVALREILRKTRLVVTPFVLLVNTTSEISIDFFTSGLCLEAAISSGEGQRECR